MDMPGQAGEWDAPATLPPENAMSRRYLRMLEKWIPAGAGFFGLWPERPDCGHFFGGAHWYGQETIGPAEAFALASASPEYDECAGGVARADLRRMALQAARYLCFTHDTGPDGCVRPHVPGVRQENCGTKWGERGAGFFPESQCARTVAGLARICLLLREDVDDETLGMVAGIQADYAARFGRMPPRSGVYVDTQMEENGWTSWGLASAALFLSGRPEAADWESMARRWMFDTCAAPQDSRDFGAFGSGTVREQCWKTFTALPDYWAENHGMVHPSYTGAGVLSLMTVGSQYGLWGKELPPELFWNRRRVYENLKALTDGAGYAQAVQGMDWHYLPAAGSEAAHAVASVFFDDPDAAALQRRGLGNAERRQDGNGGRLYDPELAANAHDVQDPMLMRELLIAQVAHLYLLHRLFGPGAAPADEAELEVRLAGVRVFPHAGFAHHRHARGQTSFSWRNSIMALPLTREGICTMAPCAEAFLGHPVVEGHPDSHHLRDVNVTEDAGGFVAVLVVDRCQETLRQAALFASLPDGRALSFERFTALEDVQLAGLDQGFLQIINERFARLAPNCRGSRTLYSPDASKEYQGWLGTDEGRDVVDWLGRPAWVNIDDRMGIRFIGTGRTVYHNRHYFKPYRAIADDLVLSRQVKRKTLKRGEEGGRLTAVLVPEQSHQDTPHAELRMLLGPRGSVCLITDGFLAATMFEGEEQVCPFTLARPSRFQVFPGTGLVIRGDSCSYEVRLAAARGMCAAASHVISVEGDVRVDATCTGTVYASSLGGTPRVSVGEEAEYLLKSGEVRTIVG